MVGETLRQLDSHTENYNIQHLIRVCCYSLLQFVTVCFVLLICFVPIVSMDLQQDVLTKGLRNLMAKCTLSFLSSLNDQTVTNFEFKNIL